MFSYETKRASAYSADLRWRIIWQREVLGMTNREIAANEGVDVYHHSVEDSEVV